MDAADSLVPLAASAVAVAGVAAFVLADVVAYDRRSKGHAGRHERKPAAKPPAPPVEEPAAPVDEPAAREEPVDGAMAGGLAGAAGAAVADAPRVATTAPETVRAADDESMLGALVAATDVDERSVLRRVVSALVLLILTLVTAALVGAGIYRGIQSLSGG